VRANGQAPHFVELNASLGPSRCADRILAAPPMSEEERTTLILGEWQGTVNVEAYPTVDHFHEAVDRELRDRRGVGRLRHVPVISEGRKPTKRPKLNDDRPLRPLFAQVVDRNRELLPREIASLLDDQPAIVDWSRRPLWHLLAYWTIVTHGKSRGQRRIIVSRLYRTEPDVVTDEMLRYVMWHELLHDLLPGQQHDTQFRDLEHRWPDATALDGEWYSLHDRYLFPHGAAARKAVHVRVG
jgi:hypothetical protein